MINTHAKPLCDELEAAINACKAIAEHAHGMADTERRIAEAILTLTSLTPDEATSVDYQMGFRTATAKALDILQDSILKE